MKKRTASLLIIFFAALSAGLCAAGEATAAAGGASNEAESPGLAVLCGKLLTMDDEDRVINGAVVLIKGKKIEAVGAEEDVKIPEGYRVIDGRDRWVLPGLVDFHSHVAGSLGDLNDGIYLTNPGLNSLDTLTPENDYVKMGRAGGVTSMLLIPGSGTNMSGFGTLCKSAGRSTEEITIKSPGSLKIAQAGNPEWYWYGVGRSFMYWNLRTTLEEMKAYHEAWCAYEEGKAEKPPEYDPAKHDFRGLFRKEFAASIHTQGYQLMLNTVVMLWDTLDIFAVMDHSTFDGYKAAPLMKERDIVVVAGPRNIWFDRHDRRINGIPAKWHEGGVERLATNTDAPVLPLEEHSYQATIGVRMGWDDSYDALKGLTRIGAEAGMIEDLVGTIEVGKDADLVLYNGDPLDPRTACLVTIINGKVVYDAARDGQSY